MPLLLPSEGMGISVQKHNCRLDYLCDWLEASVLFFDSRISRADVVDILTDEQIYRDQDFANEFVSDMWAEIRRRVKNANGGIPLEVKRNSLKVLDNWENVPAYSFCLVLSLARMYKDWARQFGPDYNEQGELFELVTIESLKAQFNGWNIYHTGWTRNQAVRLADVVHQVADELGENLGSLEPWVDEQANEAGLDVVFYKPFKDMMVGVPLFLFQCASGVNQKEKYHQPNIRIWNKIIEFASDPKKGFSTPFAILESDIPAIVNLVDGFLADRCRLISTGLPEDEWVSGEVKERIVLWITPKIGSLPIYNT